MAPKKTRIDVKSRTGIAKPDNTVLKARIRAEYEQTDLTLAALAKRHGLKSKTTIVRWKDAEGWLRDPDGDVARHAKDTLDDLATQSPDTGHGSNEYPKIRGRNKRGGNVAKNSTYVAGTEESHRHGDTPDSEGSEAPPGGPPDPIKAVNRLTLEDMPATPMQLAHDREAAADLFRTTTRRQLGAADRMLAVGHAMLDTIHAYLVATDDDFGAAKARLVGIAPGVETLAGLMRSTAVLMETAVRIERRAVGQDGGNSQVLSRSGGAGIGSTVIPADTAALLSGLPEHLLEKLRDVTIGVAVGLQAGNREVTPEQRRAAQLPPLPMPETSEE